MSELFGLKWGDVDFTGKQVSVLRSIVKQAVGPGKTEASQKPVPLDPRLVRTLRAWRRTARFRQPTDWVFASPVRQGKFPFWGQALLRHYIRPAAVKVGITKRIGWHTFRHSYSTLLKASGADIKVMQELLRHASTRVTLDTYTQAVTVITWHRRAFAWYWTRKSRRRPGRPNVAAEIRNLIRDMSQANPLWGAPRIHGELLKLGIEIAQSTVAKYLRRPRKPPSQTWRTFLTNHLEQMASIDFFVVPTATFRILFVFVMLSHARRRVLHFQVTEHPTQEWTMQQIREAFPWEHGCRYLLRDRDAIYGGDWVAMTKGLGMEEVISAPRSPWQNPYAERVIGSIRRECLDHMIVWNERSLRRTLKNYFAYYQRSRTHLALAKDAPESRAVEKPECGDIVVIPQVGGLHHRYQRHAAEC